MFCPSFLWLATASDKRLGEVLGLCLLMIADISIVSRNIILEAISDLCHYYN